MKKRFDKKKSVTFELVRRSQKDPLISDDSKNQYVLRPVVKPGQRYPAHLVRCVRCARSH
jgi:hypothetical protein